MSFAKDLFDEVQAKMMTSIDEYERLEVGIIFQVSCTCASCMLVYVRMPVTT